MSRTRFAVLIGAIVLVGLAIVVTLVSINAANDHAECVDKYGLRAPLFCD
jgi:hypothetical protein